MTGIYLTAGQAARLIGVHINTIRRATNSGKLPCHRYGGNGGTRGWRRVSLEDLERYTGRKLRDGDGNILYYKDQDAVKAEQEHFGDKE